MNLWSGHDQYLMTIYLGVMEHTERMNRTRATGKYSTVADGRGLREFVRVGGGKEWVVQFQSRGKGFSNWIW